MCNMNDIEKAIEYVRDNVDLEDVLTAKLNMEFLREPLYRVNNTLCDEIYDLMEEYGSDNELPEGWWLEEHDEETILMCL